MNCFLYVYTKRFKYLYQGIFFFIIIICTVKNACTFATCDQTNTNLWVLTQGTKKRKKKFRLTCIKNHIPLNFSGKSPLSNSQENQVGLIADDNFVFAE